MKRIALSVLAFFAVTSLALAAGDQPSDDAAAITAWLKGYDAAFNAKDPPLAYVQPSAASASVISIGNSARETGT